MKIRNLLKIPSFLLLLGLVLREVLSFWTGHPFDFEIWLRNGYYVSAGMNPYANMPPIPGVSFGNPDQAIGSIGYLPLWSLLQAALYRFYVLLPVTNRFLLYFLVKQPEVLGDVLLGYVLYRAVLRGGGSSATAVAALRFWMFFPYAIIVSAVWGQFDALVAALLIIFLLSETPVQRSAALGFGVFLKVLPIILAPYLLLRGRRMERATVLLALAIPAVLTGVTFWVAGWEYSGLQTTLQNNASGSVVFGMTYMNLFLWPPVAGFLSYSADVYNVLRIMWIPAILAASVVAWRLFPDRSLTHTLQACLFLLLVFLLTRWGVDEQLLIILMPLLLLDAALWHPERRPLFHWTWITGLVFLVVNTDLLLLFVGPIDSDLVRMTELVNSGLLLRKHLLHVIGVFFSTLLVQLAVVVAEPRRDATPWPVLLLRFLRRVRIHLGPRIREERLVRTERAHIGDGPIVGVKCLEAPREHFGTVTNALRRTNVVTDKGTRVDSRPFRRRRRDGM